MMGLFIVYYIRSFQLDQALSSTLDSYIPIAGTTLLITFLIPIKSKHLIATGLLYCILIISLQFVIKDVLLPYTKTKPQIVAEDLNTPYSIVLQEFEHISSLPYKNGMLIQNSDMCFIFGTIAQQNPSSYLIKNVFFKTQVPGQQALSLFSEYAKIIDNQIIFYQASFSQQKKPPQDLPKNYFLPLPFNIYSFFELWNTSDPRQIELLPIILYRSFSQSFTLPILLALSYYLIGFILLLIVCTIATSISGYLAFNKLKFVGSTAILVCSYPFVLLMYYYLLLIAQSIVYSLIKI
ncbi:MAG: hypothetical protein ACRCWI_07555 [Brevinema sp.]